jgi:hypothetical protein
MGTLGGHLLPGTFFILIGLWWSFITAMRYVQSKVSGRHGRHGYKTTVTMPFVCLPCASLRRAPIESYIKAILALIGLLGEVITGFHYYPAPKLEFDAMKSTSGEIMSHDHDHEHHRRRRDAPMGQSVPEVYVTKWFFEYVNAQHITMYSAFILGAFVEIMRYHRVGEFILFFFDYSQ